MSNITCKLFKVLFVLYVIFGSISLNAETIQIPQWYKMSTTLEKPPVIGKAVDLNVELQAIVGDLNNISVKLILPDGWTVDKTIQKLKKIDSGKSETIKFSVIPKTELSQGSIVVESIFDVPKKNINAAIDKIATDKKVAESMKESVNSWESPTKRYSDASFAILPEESFYPLSNDMWISYADDLSINKSFRGPVFYSDPMISIHQAQTDIEMFNKLRELIKTDESLVGKLTENGIDLDKKRFDYLNGLYVLAVDACQNQEYQTSLDFLEQLEKEASELKKAFADYLKIATNNMRALVFWKQGQSFLPKP
jgi:hypothetical protein